jgi:hypothetical protein
VAALILLAGVMVQSVYPVPEAPACYLPYEFVAIVAFGLFLSWRVRRRSGTRAHA